MRYDPTQPPTKGRRILTARANPRITTLHHDPAYLLSLGLTGLELDRVLGHKFYITAWISTDPDEFKVPTAGYAIPRTGLRCGRCPDRHSFIQGDYFTPPYNDALWREVSGHPIKIIMGPK